MNGLEIEVKFFVPRPDGLRRRIVALGATSDGRVLESNELFDDPCRSLTARGELLRLRQDTACRLTYKQPAEGRHDQFKVLREQETVVADARVMRSVFAALGLVPILVYEKWRETFRLGKAHLCLDQMPFGHFLEIEGQRDEIRGLAADLGLPWPRRIVCNYHQLFKIVADEMRLSFTDITFANFHGLAVDMRPYRHRFEAGEQVRRYE